MRAGPGWFWLVYEKGVDYMNLDFDWYDDIASKLNFSPKTSLNLLCLPELLQTQLRLNSSASLKQVLDFLWVTNYKIVTSYIRKSQESLKQKGVISVGFVSHWELVIDTIDSHYNPWDGYLRRSSFAFSWMNEDLPYILFYDKQKSQGIIDRLTQFFSEKQSNTLNSIANNS